jgi:carbon storage regulator
VLRTVAGPQRQRESLQARVDEVNKPLSTGAWSAGARRPLAGDRGSQETSMLYLIRKPGEAVIVNPAIEIRGVEVRGKTVKLGFTSPPEASVRREQVFEAINEANRAGLETARALPTSLAAAPRAALT